MLTFTQYLTEAALSRQPKVTDKQEMKNNRWLFNHVGGAIVGKITEAGARVQFAAEGDDPGYQYTRNMLYVKGGRRHKDWIMSGITLVTDSKRGIVSLVFRGAPKRYKYQFEDADGAIVDVFDSWVMNGGRTPVGHTIVNQLAKVIEPILKKIGKIDDKSKIDSGRQYGFTWKLKDLKFDVEPAGHVRSNPKHPLEANRKTNERAQTKKEISDAEANRIVKQMADKITNVRSEMKSGNVFGKLEALIKQADAKIIDVSKSRWGAIHRPAPQEGVMSIIAVTIAIYFEDKNNDYLAGKGKDGERDVYGFQYDYIVTFDPTRHKYEDLINKTPEQLEAIGENDRSIRGGRHRLSNGIFITRHNAKDFKTDAIRLHRNKRDRTRLDADGKTGHFFPHEQLEKKLLAVCDKSKLKDFAKIREA